MPDISKINALAIGSVRKVDGFCTAHILDIDGLTVPPVVIPAPSAAYSVRLLGSAVGISSYTGACMRIRRASDNVEADVGFDASNELSLTSPISNTSDALSYTDFADFVDHTGTPTSAFVKTWYNQIGSNDATQSTAANQPVVYDSTSGLITEGSVGNEKAAVEFIGGAGAFPTNRHHFITGSYIVELSQNNASAFVASSQSSVGAQSYILAEADSTSPYSSNYIFGGGGGGNPVVWVNATTFGTMPNGQSLTGFDYNGSTFQAYVDGATSGSSGSATVNAEVGTYTYIGCRADAAQDFLVGKIQEIITYKSDQSCNRTGIESNINGFFNIY